MSHLLVNPLAGHARSRVPHIARGRHGGMRCEAPIVNGGHRRNDDCFWDGRDIAIWVVLEHAGRRFAAVAIAIAIADRRGRRLNAGVLGFPTSIGRFRFRVEFRLGLGVGNEL